MARDLGSEREERWWCSTIFLGGKLIPSFFVAGSYSDGSGDDDGGGSGIREG